MNFRRAVYLFGLGCLLLSGLTARLLAATPADPQPMARVHWLGLPKVTADVNSAHFMSVWRLPQTAALVNQTLDKMSRLPGHGATNVASALLRPLLDDLITSEFYLEVYATSNSVAEIGNRKWLLALRLPPDRARLWQSVELLPQVDKFNNYVVNFEIGVEAAVSKSFSLKTYLDDTYVNIPAAGRKQNDAKLVAGISYKF